MYKLCYQFMKTETQFYPAYVFKIEMNHGKDCFQFYKNKKIDNPIAWEEFNFIKDINE